MGRLLDEDDVLNAVDQRIQELQSHPEFRRKHADIDLYGIKEYIRQIPTAQQWILCSKQKYPSDNREVEVTCEFTRYDGKKIRYTCHASYVHRYSIETTYDDWENCEEYNEEKDMYYALPGWYERIHNWDDYSYCAIEDRVVAWRELSEPWKGEQP